MVDAQMPRPVSSRHAPFSGQLPQVHPEDKTTIPRSPELHTTYNHGRRSIRQCAVSILALLNEFLMHKRLLLSVPFSKYNNHSKP